MEEVEPKMGMVFMGIFPNAFEAKPLSVNEIDDMRYVIVFDPKNFRITPHQALMMQQLGYTLDSIRYNPENDMMEIEV